MGWEAHILRGVPRDGFPDTLIRAAEQAMNKPPLESKWSDWRPERRMRTHSAHWFGDTLVIVGDAMGMAWALSRRHSCPYLWARLQEGDHWDFGLSHGERAIADFSTRVAAFDYDGVLPRPWKKGGPEAVAETLGVPLSRIERYLVDWDSLPPEALLREKAYPDDRYCYGDGDQLSDFMRAIGANDPETPRSAWLSLQAPYWGSRYVRQPWHRRVVRQVSVWLRGTYPDRPRATPESKRIWAQRKANVRIVRVDVGDTLRSNQQH